MLRYLLFPRRSKHFTFELYLCVCAKARNCIVKINDNNTLLTLNEFVLLLHIFYSGLKDTL